MSRSLLPLLLALVLAAPLRAEPVQLRIGMIVVQSGEWANVGTSAVNAVRLAHESLPDGLRGRVQVIFEDDHLSPAQAVAAFQKLRASDRIDGLILWSSGTAKAVAPLAEAARVPTLAIASDPSVARGRRFVFNIWVMPETQSELLVREALSRGYETVARITTTHEGSLACRVAFDAAARGRVEIVLDQEFSPADRDFRSYLAKLAARRNVDAVLAILNAGQLGLFAKQLREQGLQQPLFGFETFEDPNEVAISQGALGGAWYAAGAEASPDYLGRYRQRFGSESLLTSSNSYDAFNLLVQTLSRPGTPEDAAQQLAALRDYHGASGVFSASGDHRFTLPALLKTVTASDFAPLAQAGP